MTSEVFEVLESGSMRRPGVPNPARGSLECRLQRFVSVRELAVVSALSDDDPQVRLIWAWKNDGNETIVRTMERLNDVERLVNQKIIAKESPRKGWTAKTEEVEGA